jgi:hypothetical protein
VTEPVLESAARRPLPPLRPFVERYSGYRMAGFRPGLHRGLPSRHLTFIISLAGPVEIAAMPDILQAPAALSAFVGGLHNGPAAIVHDGTQVGVSLSLRAEIGLPPKVLARVARFDRARRLLGRSTPPAEVAALTGYYDQAHLNRDFKEMAGCSPTTWLAEELPIVQDSGAAGGAR